MIQPNLSIVPEPRRRRIPPLRSGVYILPNLFTTGCLVAGFYSIICTHDARYRTAAYMILLAQVCDMLDGRIARLTRATSSFGVQYDSLADLIAFGVAPAFLVYTWALTPWNRWGWLAATAYVVCAALRLARAQLLENLPRLGEAVLRGQRPGESDQYRRLARARRQRHVPA